MLTGVEKLCEPGSRRMKMPRGLRLDAPTGVGNELGNAI